MEVVDKSTDPETPDISMLTVGSQETINTTSIPVAEAQAGTEDITEPEANAEGDGLPCQQVDSPERPRKQATATV